MPERADPIPFGHVRCPQCQTDIRLPAHEPVVPQDPDLPPGVDLAFGELVAIPCPTCGTIVDILEDQAWFRPNA
jgi:endogenous inhibitor of DNA gyrase (YacG/DUF329 family)